MQSMIMFTLFGVTLAQPSALDLLASAAIGGSSSTSAVQASGDAVTGTITSQVDQTSSTATAVTTATGSAPSTSTTTLAPILAPTPTPTVVPHPVPTPKPTKKVSQHTMAFHPKPKGYVHKIEKKVELVCADVKNGTCMDIEKYEHCGFCVVAKYPTVGSGCTYTKKTMKKDGKKGEHEDVLMPECNCNGTFILKADHCPACEHALEELLVCAGTTKKDTVIEIPAKCVEKIGVSIEYLVKCGYVEVEDSEKEKDPKPDSKKYVVKEEKKEDPNVVIVLKENHLKPVHTKYVAAPKQSAAVPAVPVASANAEATAIGMNVTASATATAGN